MTAMLSLLYFLLLPTTTSTGFSDYH